MFEKGEEGRKVIKKFHIINGHPLANRRFKHFGILEDRFALEKPYKFQDML